MYGEDFDVLETKEGIVIAAENDPGDLHLVKGALSQLSSQLITTHSLRLKQL